MEAYRYLSELQLFRLAAATSVAFNAPKEVKKLEPGYNDPIDLETLHPMLRGSLGGH